MCSCHYPRMLCYVFWSQIEYRIVCFITPTNYISLEKEFIVESESFYMLENILISQFYEQFSRSSRN